MKALMFSRPVLFRVCLLSFVFVGCRGQTSQDAPIVPIRNMYDQPRVDAQETSTFFEDGRAMRFPVNGAVAQEMEVNLAVQTGMDVGSDSWLMTIPESILEKHKGSQRMLERGKERYEVYCSTCHGFTGHGNGMVARRASKLMAAALVPPTFHEDRIRKMPDGQLYATITNGIRNMPAYRHNISIEDRWAVVSYVRALQINQMQMKPEGMEEETP